jgi:hypothetical protein
MGVWGLIFYCRGIKQAAAFSIKRKLLIKIKLFPTLKLMAVFNITDL